MLRVEALEAGYGATRVLRGVSLEAKAGEIVAVLGANGVGKTTLNRALSGLVKPTAGTITFDGADITGTTPDAIVTRGLIHVPEGRKIYPNMSVADNLILGSYRRGKPNRQRNMARVYDIFPRLAERRTQSAGTLSGGEQQMLAIGRGLMAEPRLLIMDEPSLGLSPLLVEEMFALVARVAKDGLAVMLVEQNVVQSLALAERAYVLEQGQIVMSGPAQDLARDAHLRKAYLGL
jgi:branched-chain amino acid transport system ATP-binding protein